MTTDSRKIVWIFGAGITGLSAAHELAERGFEVHVVEPAEDVFRAGTPAVGGVARTQWALLPDPAPGGGALPAAPPAPPLPSLLFDSIDPVAFATGADVQVGTFFTALRAALPVSATLPTLEAVVYNTLDPFDGPLGTLVEVAAGGALPFFEGVARELSELLAPHHVPGDVVLNTVPLRHGEPWRVELRVSNAVLPGEHGFRYFPGFYRHLFDTMKRTPISYIGEAGYQAVTRTVYDNLVPTRATYLISADRRRVSPAVTAPESPSLASVPRVPSRSPTELLHGAVDVLRKIGHAPAEASRIALKIFQYMTSSNARRAREFENITWWEFIQGDTFNEPCRTHLDSGPEVLGAMSSREADARTQGTCLVQLLMDQLTGRSLTDATLNGPTSVAWLNPWRAYLEARNVQFWHGKILDFRALEDLDEVVPEVELLGGTPLDMEDVLRTAIFQGRELFFILAVPLTEMMAGDGEGPFDPISASAHPGLARRFLDARALLPGPRGETRDFEAIRVWSSNADFPLDGWNQPPAANGTHRSALRHLVGVQYFFPVNVQLGVEHALYLDSDWRLSSISQIHFWNVMPAWPCRGIVSVDIGALHRPIDTGFARNTQTLVANRTAWNCSAREIAHEVWRQVGTAIQTTTSTGGAVSLNSNMVPRPSCFHLDENLVFNSGEGTVKANQTPYLINRPGEWTLRPGRLAPEGYEVQAERWVLAGCYMKTYTRLTTMEAANESARHAVNAILHASRVEGDRCRIWNPEEHELPDLQFLKDLDALLVRDGLPHFVEILGLDEVPDALLPTAPLTVAPQ